MGRLRPMKSSAVIKILTAHYGYTYIGTKGSHAHFKNASGRKTTIPLYHELYPKMIRLILHDTDLNWEDIEKYL